MQIHLEEIPGPGGLHPSRELPVFSPITSAPGIRKSCLIFPLLVFLTFLPGCRSAGHPGPVDRSDVPIEIIEVGKHIRVVQDGNYWGANSVFYVSDSAIFFIDGTYVPQTARRVIWKSMTEGLGEFKGVLVSSYHVHRTGGLSAFHEKEIPVLATVETEKQIRLRWPLMKKQMELFVTWPDPPMPLISRTVRKSGTLFDGKVEAIMLPPCYAPGNMAFFFPEEKVLYAGSILSIPLFFDNQVNPAEMKRCLSILKAKAPKTIIAGHGSPLRGPEFLQEFELYLKARARSED
ncbi:MAG: hypothetical protein KDK25_01965 [Leptospiraceae bacterium]|nr:hypothetical protein [Leptospiraceae bacterium]